MSSKPNYHFQVVLLYLVVVVVNIIVVVVVIIFVAVHIGVSYGQYQPIVAGGTRSPPAAPPAKSKMAARGSQNGPLGLESVQ